MKALVLDSLARPLDLRDISEILAHLGTLDGGNPFCFILLALARALPFTGVCTTPM